MQPAVQGRDKATGAPITDSPFPFTDRKHLAGATVFRLAQPDGRAGTVLVLSDATGVAQKLAFYCNFLMTSIRHAWTR